MDNRLLALLRSEVTNINVREAAESLIISRMKTLRLSDRQQYSELLGNLCTSLLGASYLPKIESLSHVLQQFADDISSTKIELFWMMARREKRTGKAFATLIAKLV